MKILLEFHPYRFAFYEVTVSGKTGLAMKLTIEAENAGLILKENGVT
jgi:hypothetical protein